MSTGWATTSEAHPIRVDCFMPEVPGLPGRLGMTVGPGLKGDATGGHWERDLDRDLARITRYYGADVLVSLVKPDERAEYTIPDLLERAGATGLEAIPFPITDVRTPRDDQTGEYIALVARIIHLLSDGKTVVIHYRGGLGRTGMMVASVLVAVGNEADGG